MTWSWPGNIRELRNVLERSSVMADQGRITSVSLARRTNVHNHHQETVADVITNGKESEDTAILKEASTISEGFSLDDHLAVFEKDLILRALKQAGGVQARAAILLGINQRSLWHRIKKYEIDVSAIKNNDSLSP